MSVKGVWIKMSLWYRVLVVVGVVLTSIGAGYAIVSEFSSHPGRITAVEVADSLNKAEHRGIDDSLDSLRIGQQQGNEKLDRVICILEGNQPLSCERSN